MVREISGRGPVHGKQPEQSSPKISEELKQLREKTKGIAASFSPLQPKHLEEHTATRTPHPTPTIQKSTRLFQRITKR